MANNRFFCDECRSKNGSPHADDCSAKKTLVIDYQCGCGDGNGGVKIYRFKTDEEIAELLRDKPWESEQCRPVDVDYFVISGKVIKEGYTGE